MPILRSELFLSTFWLFSLFSAEMESRIEIFMLKFAREENFVLFGHSGHELQRFKDFSTEYALQC